MSVHALLSVTSVRAIFHALIDLPDFNTLTFLTAEKPDLEVRSCLIIIIIIIIIILDCYSSSITSLLCYN